MSEAPDRLVHDAISELLGVYALHALEPEEAAEVDIHLETCADCRTELVEHLDVAAALGSMDLEPVREGMLDDIFARVRREDDAAVVDLSSAPAGSPARAASVDGDVDLDVDRVATVIALDAAREARRHRTRRWRTGVAAAVIAGAIAVPSVVALQSTTPSLAALATKAASRTGSHTVLLKDTAGHSLAKVVVGADGIGYLVSNTLAVLPDDRTYQLWAVTSSDSGTPPISAGLLGSHPGVVPFTVAATTAAYALSVEPKAGSLKATTTPFAIGTVV